MSNNTWGTTKDEGYGAKGIAYKFLSDTIYLLSCIFLVIIILFTSFAKVTLTVSLESSMSVLLTGFEKKTIKNEYPTPH
jgi:hypothetical protein